MNTLLLTAFMERMLQTPWLNERNVDCMVAISLWLAIYFASRLILEKQEKVKRLISTHYGMHVVSFKNPPKALSQHHSGKLKAIK